MFVGSDFSEKTVSKHLKITYGIHSKFVSAGVINKPYSRGFYIFDEMIIADLIKSFKLFGARLKLYNSAGVSIPNYYSLVNARDFNIFRDKEHDFNQLMTSIVSLSSSSNYSDVEWIKRIFFKLINKAINTDQTNLIKEFLEYIFQNNDKFLESDYRAIIEKLKIKKSIM